MPQIQEKRPENSLECSILNWGGIWVETTCIFKEFNVMLLCFSNKLVNMVFCEEISASSIVSGSLELGD